MSSHRNHRFKQGNHGRLYLWNVIHRRGAPRPSAEYTRRRDPCPSRLPRDPLPGQPSRSTSASVLPIPRITRPGSTGRGWQRPRRPGREQPRTETQRPLEPSLRNGIHSSGAMSAISAARSLPRRPGRSSAIASQQAGTARKYTQITARTTRSTWTTIRLPPGRRRRSSTRSLQTGSSALLPIFRRVEDKPSLKGNGTLRGIIEKLDYIASLGVNCLWLTPVFPSPSYHGYDATSFFEINPRLGTKEDFKELVDQAHARGIRVLMDFVPNHWSNRHPSFHRSTRDPNSPIFQVVYLRKTGLTNISASSRQRSAADQPALPPPASTCSTPPVTGWISAWMAIAWTTASVPPRFLRRLPPRHAHVQA
jgi:hypothetical protein